MVDILAIAARLAGIFVLAFLAESLTEYFARPFLKPETLPGVEPAPAAAGNGQRVIPAFVLRYAAAGVGILLAVAYRADVLALFGLEAWFPWIGWVVTGIILGRGANYLHDVIDRWQAPVQRG